MEQEYGARNPSKDYKNQYSKPHYNMIYNRKKRGPENLKKQLKSERRKKLNYLKTTQWMFEMKNRLNPQEYFSPFL